jgi:hypothetical protein
MTDAVCGDISPHRDAKKGWWLVVAEEWQKKPIVPPKAVGHMAYTTGLQYSNPKSDRKICLRTP